MTLNIKKSQVGGYSINMEIDKNGVYHVDACPIIRDGICGYPDRETYTVSKSAANSYYYYLRRVYKQQFAK